MRVSLRRLFNATNDRRVGEEFGYAFTSVPEESDNGCQVSSPFVYIKNRQQRSLVRATPCQRFYQDQAGFLP